MKTETARRLAELNRQFYEQFAEPFAESRAAIQPGMLRALEALKGCRSLLDVGCGDGRVAQALAGLGWRGDYTGVDASRKLLALARDRALPSDRNVFVEANLMEAAWRACLPRQPFDGIVSFAVLHHIPGGRRRLRLMRQIASLLKPGGMAVISTWQFMDDERLKRKIVPWARLGLRAEEVDAGDCLLDWKRGGEGLRYVSALDEAALRRLARAAGLEVVETYRADGRSGDLSLYAILMAGERTQRV